MRCFIFRLFSHQISLENCSTKPLISLALSLSHLHHPLCSVKICVCIHLDIWWLHVEDDVGWLVVTAYIKKKHNNMNLPLLFTKHHRKNPFEKLIWEIAFDENEQCLWRGDLVWALFRQIYSAIEPPAMCSFHIHAIQFVHTTLAQYLDYTQTITNVARSPLLTSSLLPFFFIIPQKLWPAFDVLNCVATKHIIFVI